MRARMLQCALSLDKHPAEFVNIAAAPTSAMGRFGGSVLRSQQFGLVLVLLLLGTALTIGAGSHTDPRTNSNRGSVRAAARLASSPVLRSSRTTTS